MAIIGFYSVKGGSTRTTLAVNLAFSLILNNPSMKIGLVDCDFEQAGAGMDVFLATALSRQLLNINNGKGISDLSETLQALYADKLDGTLVDVLVDSNRPRKKRNVLWIDATEIMGLVATEQRPWLETIKDRIWFMPCGRGWAKLASIQYNEVTIGRIGETLWQMQQACGLTHIFIDCRSGIADSAFASLMATDFLVMPVLPSNMHLQAAKDGTEVLRKIVVAYPKRDTPRDIVYAICMSPDDENVIRRIEGFFEDGSDVAVMPFHSAMVNSEVIAAIPDESGFSPDDQRYLEALDELWRLMCIRIG